MNVRELGGGGFTYIHTYRIPYRISYRTYLFICLFIYLSGSSLQPQSGFVKLRLGDARGDLRLIRMRKVSYRKYGKMVNGKNVVCIGFSGWIKRHTDLNVFFSLCPR